MQRLIDFLESKPFGIFILVVIGFVISFEMNFDGWRALLLPLGSAIAYWSMFDKARGGKDSPK
jgi:hypothetical protein